jgi:hypothetical protein
MNYPCYCRTCNMITGHETRHLRSTCQKCGAITTTPILRWSAGLAFIIALGILAIWVIVSGALTLRALF